MSQFDKLPRAQIIAGRACKNCTGPIPKLSNKGGALKRKAFCCDNCRKEFHKNNGISVHRLKEQVQEWVAESLRPLEQAVADLQELMMRKTSAHPKASNGRHAADQNKKRARIDGFDGAPRMEKR